MKLTLPTSAGRRTYAALATELRRVADSIAGLPGSHVYAKVDIQPGPSEGDDDEIVSRVDALATVVLGRPGKTDDFGGGMTHHRAIESSPTLNIAIYQRVTGRRDAKDAEIERLRAELAAERTAAFLARCPDNGPHLWVGRDGRPATGGPEDRCDSCGARRGDRTGMGYSREPEDPTPGDVPNGVEGGSVAGRASVPVLCAAVLADGVACGARIYWNVAANAWWHLWRKGEGADVLKHTATGPSVPPLPDMQARPQCSCRDSFSYNDEPHHDGCPLSTT